MCRFFQYPELFAEKKFNLEGKNLEVRVKLLSVYLGPGTVLSTLHTLGAMLKVQYSLAALTKDWTQWDTTFLPNAKILYGQSWCQRSLSAWPRLTQSWTIVWGSFYPTLLPSPTLFTNGRPASNSPGSHWWFLLPFPFIFHRHYSPKNYLAFQLCTIISFLVDLKW